SLRTWYHDGRLYVAGAPGTRYGLRFANHTGGRVLAVVSVDGVNIITGETANYNQRGYVLDPWQTINVNGWRKSETTVAAFQFAPLGGSYAAKTGRPGDVGVIGMAVFQERRPPPEQLSENMARPAPDIVRRAPAPAPLAVPAPAPAMAPPARMAPSLAAPPAPPPAARSAAGALASPALADEKLGTAHGASEWSVITLVDFARATSAPQAVTTIEYDSWDHLVAAGVIPSDVHRHPHPFPGEPRLSYVPDPPP
ncbi:MAG TPA: hypothetical protein VFA87_02755, partial [Rhizomicrobium sp.]|nr:hypothetical protein [Rhizomicrobium sp.]